MPDLDMNQIETLASNLRAVSDATYPTRAIVGSEYNSTLAYTIGSYCIKDGLLYKCNTAIASGGEIWNSSHWTETNIINEITNKVLYFTNVVVSATTGNIVTLNDSRISADYILTECVFSNPEYVSTNITWTTAAGSLVVNGTCLTSTTANITLIKKDN